MDDITIFLIGALVIHAVLLFFDVVFKVSDYSSVRLLIQIAYHKFTCKY